MRYTHTCTQCHKFYILYDLLTTLLRNRERLSTQHIRTRLMCSILCVFLIVSFRDFLAAAAAHNQSRLPYGLACVSYTTISTYIKSSRSRPRWEHTRGTKILSDRRKGAFLSFYFASPSGNDRGKHNSDSNGRRYLNTRVSRGKKCTREEVFVVCVFPIALSLCLKKRKDSPVQVRWVVGGGCLWVVFANSVNLSQSRPFFVTHVNAFVGSVCVVFTFVFQPAMTYLLRFRSILESKIARN